MGGAMVEMMGKAEEGAMLEETIMVEGGVNGFAEAEKIELTRG